MNKTRFICMIALMIGLWSSAGCSPSNSVDTAVNGTWAGSMGPFDIEWKLSNGSIETSSLGLRNKGTYTTENKKLTINYTHTHGDGIDELFKKIGLNLNLELKSQWYTINELAILIKPKLQNAGMSEREANQVVAQMFTTDNTVTYSVDSKSLILIIEGQMLTLTKK